jgi:hypothetical protein
MIQAETLRLSLRVVYAALIRSAVRVPRIHIRPQSYSPHESSIPRPAITVRTPHATEAAAFRGFDAQDPFPSAIGRDWREWEREPVEVMSWLSPKSSLATELSIQ